MESDGAKTPTSPRAQSADEQSGPEDDAREKDSNRKLLPKRSTLEKKSTKAILIEKKVQEEFGKLEKDEEINLDEEESKYANVKSDSDIENEFQYDVQQVIPLLQFKDKESIREKLYDASQVIQESRDETTPDWNEQFQLILERPTTTVEEAKERADAVSRLAEEFSNSALATVKTILKEKKIPNEQKTIKAIDSDGRKFIHNGMYLKIVYDTHEMYSEPFEQPHKNAAQSVRGLNYILGCHVDNLFVPLTSLITYQGFTVLAMSVMPINAETTIYGIALNVPINSVQDVTMLHRDSRMNEMMQKVARTLNVKNHVIGVGRQQKIISTNADIQGHLAEDGRRYVFNTARLWPPETPQEKYKENWVF